MQSVEYKVQNDVRHVGLVQHFVMLLIDALVICRERKQLRDLRLQPLSKRLRLLEREQPVTFGMDQEDMPPRQELYAFPCRRPLGSVLGECLLGEA